MAATGGKVAPGTRLNGIYEIRHHIATGGMGEVYLGQEIQTGKPVAIKMILPEFAHDEIILEMFRKEALTLGKLSHDAIVRYYLFSLDPEIGRHYLAMEFVDGPSLVRRLRERPLDARELGILRVRIASGLATAHREGVYHRDVSPDNVILVEGEVAKAKIIDFGIAKSASTGRTLIGSGFAGKLNYVSPEQLGLGGQEVGAASDIYSLGLVLAEAAIGRPLPMGGSHAEVLEKRRTVPDLSEVPEHIRPLVEWMLQPDPADRPASMEEVAAWDPKRGGRGGGDGGGGGRRFPKLLGAALVVLVLAGAIIGALATGLIHIGEPTPPPAELSAIATGEVAAAAGKVGADYGWTRPLFSYTGPPGTLAIAAEGALPPGLALMPGADGSVTLSGRPTAAGSFRVALVASGPGGLSARQQVSVEIAAAAPPPTANKPPRIADQIAQPVALNQGDQVNLRLGGFDDEDRGALTLAVSGSVPAGLRFIDAGNGVAQLVGSPSQSGSFTFAVTATDPQGLTARLDIRLEVAPPAPPVDPLADLRNFIADYKGGDCFLGQPLELGPRLAHIEIYFADTDPVFRFDTDFKARWGFEAQIEGRQVTRAQCSVLRALAGAGPEALGRKLHFKLSRDNLRSGEVLEGGIEGASDARLFIVSNIGAVVDLGAFTRPAAGATAFRFKPNGEGPHILLAAAGGAPDASFKALIEGARSGQVALALGYILLNP